MTIQDTRTLRGFSHLIKPFGRLLEKREEKF